MKKIFYIGLIALFLVLYGCGPEQPEGGATPINVSELTEVKETAEVPEQTQETSTVKEMPTIIVTEGETVKFPNLKAVDPDGDKITYTFSSPLNDKGEWQTKEGDAGEYDITITASDGKSEATQDVKIIIQALNKAPVLEKMSDMTIKEGETLKLSPKALDPEGKTLTFTYSGWMTSDTKQLNYNEAGDYIVRVTVSDGKKEASQDVKITVEDVNRAPTFEKII